jgi:hypothetical protein
MSSESEVAMHKAKRIREGKFVGVIVRTQLEEDTRSQTIRLIPLSQTGAQKSKSKKKIPWNALFRS